MRLAPLFAGIFACAFAATASAHTPYLAPSTFAPRAGDTVALDAAFAETFFVPETVFDNSRFTVIGPDGREAALDNVQLLKVRAIAHADSPLGDTLTLSGGITTCVPDDSTNAESMIMRADQALYAAKAQGCNRFFSFEMQMDTLEQLRH